MTGTVRGSELGMLSTPISLAPTETSTLTYYVGARPPVLAPRISVVLLPTAIEYLPRIYLPRLVSSLQTVGFLSPPGIW